MPNTLKIHGAAKHISVLAFMCYSETRTIFGHVFPPFVHVSSTCNQINEQEMIKGKTGFVTAPDLFGKCLRFFFFFFFTFFFQPYWGKERIQLCLTQMSATVKWGENLTNKPNVWKCKDHNSSKGNNTDVKVDKVSQRVRFDFDLLVFGSISISSPSASDVKCRDTEIWCDWNL